MKCWDMKRILALPTCQKICSDKEPEQIDFGKFDLGHPVLLGVYVDFEVDKKALVRVKKQTQEIVWL